MQAVGLVQARGHGHAGQQVGIERDAVAAGEVRIDAVEVPGVAGAQAGGRAQPAEHRLDPARLQPGEDAVEVGACRGRRQALQHIVAAELHDADRGVRLDAEVEPRQAARRRVARKACAPHFGAGAQPGQRRLKLGRQRVLRPQPIAGRDGVAEEGHHSPPSRGGAGVQGRGQGGQSGEAKGAKDSASAGQQGG